MYFSIVFAFAGDSTMTRLLATNLLRSYKTRCVRIPADVDGPVIDRAFSAWGPTRPPRSTLIPPGRCHCQAKQPQSLNPSQVHIMLKQLKSLDPACALVGVATASSALILGRRGRNRRTHG